MTRYTVTKIQWEETGLGLPSSTTVKVRDDTDFIFDAIQEALEDKYEVKPIDFNFTEKPLRT